MDGFNLIEEHLYLSGVSKAQNLELLKEKNIKYVLSIFDDKLTKKSEEVTYMKIYARDDPFQDLLTHFPETNKFIETAQKSQKNVLVHCHAGLSRSATIVVAFIMNKHKMSYESAFELVNTRHVIMPDDGFVDQLQLYEKMGFTLNANNRELRRHLIKTYFNDKYRNKNKNRIEVYFERRDYIKSMTQDLDLGKRCLCANCGQHLFNEIHILLTNTTEKLKSSEECVWTYIEPQKWMKELNPPFDNMIVKCPKCEEELIEFNEEFDKYKCRCRQHKGEPENCLYFRIANRKFKIESN